MSDKNMSDFLGNIRGKVTITERDKATGEIISQDVEDNLFLNLGRSGVFRAITTQNTENYVVNTLKFGDDVGPAPADLFNPQPAQLDFGPSTQDVIFQIDRPNLVISYPTFDRVRFSCVLDGGDILDMFPGNVDVRYTSLALYTNIGDPIAYRRFSVRSISRLVNVDINWDIYFV